ncbi:hypothetical protein BGW36DRAFT_423187 [Talaromyces proteolyticus]|uniref:Uncharacterized protein n=1 Tax=Talaromyces proteolyticus TaxID=1131652 RepID=A0AAD4KZT9_9EURO|nr:uncharacterized protein BGW36DRAFT_423187 [Talaromyces proteolyticus]KAH8703634.1 hypothetical protein BGW36DRAFT_423187 [Talaromyces proteolyticus]
MKIVIFLAGLIAQGALAALTVNFYSDASCTDVVETIHPTANYAVFNAPAGVLSALWTDHTDNYDGFENWFTGVTPPDSSDTNWYSNPTGCIGGATGSRIIVMAD